MGKKGGKKKNKGGSSTQSAPSGPSNVPPTGSTPSDTATPSIEAEKQDEGPKRDGIHLYTVTIKMQNGDTIELQLSPGDTVMDVKQCLQNASKNRFQNLVLHDKKNEPLADHIKISDVADTVDCRLEMVAVSNDDQSIITNVHHTGVSSSLARNTSSNLEDHTRDVVRVETDNNTNLQTPSYRCTYTLQPLSYTGIFEHSTFEVGEPSSRPPKLHPILHPDNNPPSLFERGQRGLAWQRQLPCRRRRQPRRIATHLAPPERIVPPPPPSPFAVNERVLVFFHQRLYEGKVLKTNLFEQTWWRYYICYLVQDPPKWLEASSRNRRAIQPKEEEWSEWHGWNEWLGPKRLLKRTRKNLNKMGRLQSTEGSISWPVKRPKKEQGPEDPIDKIREKMERKLGVMIPSSLLLQWIEDKELSLHVGQIVDIPVMTVMDIFQNFNAIYAGGMDELLNQFDEQLVGVGWQKCSMRLICGIFYKTEGYGSYDELESIVLSTTYGVEHLLRMMVKLFKIPRATTILQNSRTDLQRLFYYLEENLDQLFVTYPNQRAAARRRVVTYPNQRTAARRRVAANQEDVRDENPLAMVVYKGGGDNNQNQAQEEANQEVTGNQEEDENHLAMVVYEGGGDNNQNQAQEEANQEVIGNQEEDEYGALRILAELALKPRDKRLGSGLKN